MQGLEGRSWDHWVGLGWGRLGGDLIVLYSFLSRGSQEGGSAWQDTSGCSKALEPLATSACLCYFGWLTCCWASLWIHPYVQAGHTRSFILQIFIRCWGCQRKGLLLSVWTLQRCTELARFPHHFLQSRPADPALKFCGVPRISWSSWKSEALEVWAGGCQKEEMAIRYFCRQFLHSLLFCYPEIISQLILFI